MGSHEDANVRMQTAERRHRTGLVTLVFTDIVDSTRLKQTLGDQAGAALIQRHRALVRELLRQFPGSDEIETAGDSFLLVFSKPSDAVQFGLVLLHRQSTLGSDEKQALALRIGIHLGEVVIEEHATGQKAKDLYGIQLDTCARVMSLAKANQLLMTRGVFDNARQVLKGEDLPEIGLLEWFNHGPYLLKGIEESVEVCEVRKAGHPEPPSPPTSSEKAKRQVHAGQEAVLGWRPAVGQPVPNTRWILENKLGEGGFGEVWLARNTTTKQARVFKFCFQADRVRFLKRELTLFRLLKERVGSHPRIVALHDVSLDQPPFYVEMEYVEGKDLRSWWEEHGGSEGIPLAARLEIVAQAAVGLQAAHDAGIIHRDVKPANLLIGGKGTGEKEIQVKITDFGIGQVLSEEHLQGITRAGFTQTMSVSSSSQTGTQLYMAPELLAGQPASIRSDIYSLGAVLYQLVAGDFRQPVTTDWRQAVSDPLLREDLQHCFAGHPEDRFAGAGQLAKNLRTWEQRKLEWERQQAAEVEREQLRQQARQRQNWFLASAGVAIILIALAAALGYGMRKAQRERAQQRKLAYAADMRATDAAIQAGNLGQAQYLLERNLPSSGDEDLRGLEWRYLWETCRSEDAGGFEYPTAPISLAISPDSRWFMMSGMDGWIRIHDMQGNEIFRHASGFNKKTFFLQRTAFSPKGDLAAAVTTSNVVIWETRQWKQQRSLPCAGFVLAFSPDGQHLAVLTAEGPVLWSTRTWEMDDTLTHGVLPNRAFHLKYTPDGKTLILGLSTPDRIGFLNLAERRLEEPNFPLKSIVRLALSPDGRWLAVSSMVRSHDETVVVWDMTHQKVAAKLPFRIPYTQGLAFSPDSQVLATAGADQLIHLWQAGTTNHLGQLQGHRSEIWGLNYTQDGQWLISASQDRTIRRWATSFESSRLMTWNIPNGLILMNVASSGAKSQIFNYKERTWEEWDLLHTNRLSRVPLQHLPSKQHLIGASWHGPFAIFGYSSNSAMFPNSAVIDTKTGMQVFPFSTQTNQFLIAAVSPQGRLISATERTGTQWMGGVWDLSTQTKRLELPDQAPDEYLSQNADFSPDGRWLAYESATHDIHLVSLANSRIRRLIGHSRPLFCLRFSPDSRKLASSSWDATARIWEVSSGRPLTPWLVGHRSGVEVLEFSPDGRTLMTGSSSDEVFRFWHVATGTEILGSRLMLLPQAQITFGSDGSTFFAGNSAEPPSILLTALPSLTEIDSEMKTRRLVRVGLVEP